MKITRSSYIFFIPILIIITLILVWMVMTNAKQYDISQLNMSKYNNTIDKDSTIILTASKGAIPISSKLFTTTITNNSDYIVTYGYYCTLETLINGKWYIVPLKKESVFAAVKVRLHEHSQNDFPIYLNMFECHPGKHRVILECNEGENRTDNIAGRKIILSCEFNLY